jgi:type II secretory pathway component PulF
MKYDELAFINQQLAAMLRTGIPLEGALRQLCADMRRGKLRSELEKLEADLARGVPMKEAMTARDLPEFYRQMVRIGVEGNDLPGVLNLLADYYHRMNSIWTRLKGVMVYPLIVLVAALGLSVLMIGIYREITLHFIDAQGRFISNMAYGTHRMVDPLPVWLFIPVVVLGMLAAGVVLGMSWPRLRRYLRWRLPGFREAAVSQVGAALALLLEGGCNLRDAVRLLKMMEAGTPLGAELQRWEQRLGEGHGKVLEMGQGSKLVPPLFFWLASGSGEDAAGGFKRAAELYHARALFRTEMFLYAALPISILALGLMVLGQFIPLVRYLTYFMDTI